MPYDRDSFLAGIAVGRNMQSWPEMHGVGLPFIYIITVDGSSDRPLSTGTPRLLFNTPGTDNWVDWGDGNTSSFGYSSMYVNPTHTYTSPGTYIVRISPTFTDFASYNGFNEISPKSLDRILTPLPKLNSGWSFPSGYFMGCSNLKSIPHGYFDAYSVGYCNDTFKGCSSLESIPNKLFANISVWGGQFNYTFMDCTSLTDVPEDLFSEQSSAMFLATFTGCDHLRSIPQKLINRSDPRDTASMFAGCVALEDVPEGFLSGCVNLLYVDSMFEGSGLESVPQTLFDDCPNITQFYNAFRDCSGITSALPELWLQYHYPDVGCGGCFAGCVNAANYSDVPFYWR